METYKDEIILQRYYALLGSTRKVASHFGVSNGTIVYWLRKYHIPRIPKLYLYDNSSGRGRLCELYIADHPYFKKHFKDFGIVDDKGKFDGTWHWDKVNIKSTHSKKRHSFRVKKKRHDVMFYICAIYDDDIDPLIPVAIYLIPSKVCPRTTITISLSKDSKYAKFRLKEGIDFSVEDVMEYNKKFRSKYYSEKK